MAIIGPFISYIAIYGVYSYSYLGLVWVQFGFISGGVGGDS